MAARVEAAGGPMQGGPRAQPPAIRRFGEVGRNVLDAASSAPLITPSMVSGSTRSSRKRTDAKIGGHTVVATLPRPPIRSGNPSGLILGRNRVRYLPI